MKKTYRLLAAVVGVLIVAIAVSGCPCHKTDPGKLSGWVADADGNMIPLVLVSLPDGSSTYTDTHGLFMFESVPAGKTLVDFALDGYVPGSQSVAVKSNQLVSISQTLEEAVEAGELADAQAGGEAADAAGNAVAIPENALATASGKQVSGSVKIEITAMNPGLPDDMNLFAGAFALDADIAGPNAQLEAYAGANINVTQNGENVELQGGATVMLTLILPPTTTLTVGQTVSALHYNSALGLWEATATGTVVQLEGGGLAVEIEVSVFGWWTVGAVIENAGCVSGVVTNNAGEPMADATVVAIGTDYRGIFVAMTDEDGAYKVYTKPNAHVRLDLIPGGGYFVASSAQVATGAPGECTTQDIQVTYTSCITGFVKEEDGTPIAGTQVFSSTGGAAVTAEDGSFCMDAPGNTYCLVYVLGRPPRVVLTPEDAACGDPDLTPVQLTVDFPKDGDMVGLISDSTVTFGVFPFPENQYHSSAALLSSGFDGDKFDLLREGVEQDEFTVRALHVDLTPLNSLYAYLGITLGPQAANLIFEVDFDINGMFDASSPNITQPTGVDVQNENDPEGGRIGPLDAGNPGQIVTTNGTLGMHRPLDELFGNGKYGTLGLYFQNPLVTTMCNYGDAVSYSFPGGVDLGAFTVDGVIPDPIVLVDPGSLQDIFVPVDGALQDLPVTWQMGDHPGDFVTLMLETIVLDTSTDSLDFGAAICSIVDDGAATIPASVLAQLPHLTQEDKDLITFKSQVTCLFAMRHGLTEANNVPLLRGAGGNGRVMLITNSDPVMKYFSFTNIEWF